MNDEEIEDAEIVTMSDEPDAAPPTIYFGYRWKPGGWQSYAAHAPELGTYGLVRLEERHHSMTLAQLEREFPPPTQQGGIMEQLRAIHERLDRWESILFGDGK